MVVVLLLWDSLSNDICLDFSVLALKTIQGSLKSLCHVSIAFSSINDVT